MKRKILLVASLAICVATIASGTLAYFTAEGQAHNVITTGKVGIELVEKTKSDSGAEIDFPEEGISGVMPGASVSKIVSVKNTGDAEAWIRVWVNVAISESGDPISNPTIKNLPLQIEKADGTMGDVVTLDFDSEKWIYKDGYYYYIDPVDPGKSTDTLFENVTFAKEMGNEYQNAVILIDVSAEAVQSANNLIPTDGDVTDIKGWSNN